MPRMLAITETRLVSEIEMARQRTIEDLKKLVESYQKSIDSPMIDLADKKQLRAMRDQFIAEIEDLRRGQE